MANTINILSKSDTGLEPVLLSVVKSHLLISHTNDDTYLEDVLLPACREELEGKLNKCLVDKTITAEITSDGKLDLLYPPVASITTATDSEGNAVELELLESRVITETKYAKIEYTVTANVTATDKLKLLELIAYKYAHRGDENKTVHASWLL